MAPLAQTLRGLNIFVIFVLLAVNPLASAAGKKFKRALIIAGGGITPGIGLGIIAGAREQGWEPDVVLTTCGASMSAAIENAFRNSDESLKFAKSIRFYDMLRLVELETANPIKIKLKLMKLAKFEFIPPVFTDNILYLIEDSPPFLPISEFKTPTVGPRFIILSAKAHFGPEDVGKLKSSIPYALFNQVYFTDPHTAESLRGVPSPIKKLFPESFFSEDTEVITDKSPEQAIRASIPDPMLMNPAKIDNQYYFTGASDIFPVHTANLLADEVLATYPGNGYKDYEDIMINSLFGLTLSQQALFAIQDPKVKWIDMTGIDEVSFNPEFRFPLLRSRIPETLEGFAEGVQKQFDFGKSRVIEALEAQKNSASRDHLREPISPALLKSYTCENAFLWSTDERKNCASDATYACDRKTAKTCTPIR